MDKGNKHICPCGAAFYDLGGIVSKCPKCGAELNASQEIDFIKKKKKAEMKSLPKDDIIIDETPMEAGESLDEDGEIYLDDTPDISGGDDEE